MVLFSQTSERVRDVLDEMESISPIGKAILNRTQLILTEPAMVYDSVQAFARGLENALKDGPELELRSVTRVCIEFK